MKVAVVGATGLVGGVIMEVLEERNFPLTTLYAVASEKSVGKEVIFKGGKHKVIGMQTAVNNKPDIAIFSAGGGTSTEWAPIFAEAGSVVIDNSSAWRMDPTKRLIVPEINATAIGPDDKIIANPNCSTIQMVLPLAPLHKAYKIKRIVVSTYQSVTGTGVKAVRQMQDERAGVEGEKAYPHPIDRNCLPHCDVFLDNAYTKEEMKMVNETRKILEDDSIMITATTVRVPVVGGHSESVNLEFEKGYEIDDIVKLLSETPGVVVQDDVANNVYPMPRYAEGKDEVFVGRIRRDESRENCLNIWIVSDNLRKGAATNAIQIAEYMVENKLV
ncbi:MAG: aspartate-semialdehyde dehydrogenase [Bacteroidales bacterium]